MKPRNRTLFSYLRLQAQARVAERSLETRYVTIAVLLDPVTEGPALDGDISTHFDGDNSLERENMVMFWRQK